MVDGGTNHSNRRIVPVTVHEPVTRARWRDDPERPGDFEGAPAQVPKCTEMPPGALGGRRRTSLCGDVPSGPRRAGTLARLFRYIRRPWTPPRPRRPATWRSRSTGSRPEPWPPRSAGWSPRASWRPACACRPCGRWPRRSASARPPSTRRGRRSGAPACSRPGGATAPTSGPRPGTRGPQRYRRMNAGPGPLGLDLSLGTPDPDLLPPLGPALADVAGRPLPQGYLADPVLPELEAALRERWPFPPGGAHGRRRSDGRARSAHGAHRPPRRCRPGGGGGLPARARPARRRRGGGRARSPWTTRAWCPTPCRPGWRDGRWPSTSSPARTTRSA